MEPSTMKQKRKCANYNYWCDKLAKNCEACDDYKIRPDFGEDE